MDRQHLQNLAKIRLKDAQSLLGRKRWSGAYYLSGYVVECALKACLLRHLGESASVFGVQGYLKQLNECWTHDVVKLVSLAGLEADFARHAARIPRWGAIGASQRTGRKPADTRRKRRSRRGNCSRR